MGLFRAFLKLSKPGKTQRLAAFRETQQSDTPCLEILRYIGALHVKFLSRSLLEAFCELSCWGLFGGLGAVLGRSWGSLGALLRFSRRPECPMQAFFENHQKNKLPCWPDHQKPKIQISGFWWSRPHGSAIFDKSRHQFRYVLNGDAFKTNGKQKKKLKTPSPLASEAIRPGRPQLRRLPRQLRRFLA